MLGPSIALKSIGITSNPRDFKTPRNFNVKLSLLCQGQMFGDEDIANNRCYTTSVKCISTHASLYCIKAEEFLNLFGKDQRTWKMVVDRVMQKDDSTKHKIRQSVYNHN